MTTSSQRTLTARDPEDVLAAVEAILGFTPEESVVMMTFGGGGPFHARADLPDDSADLPALVDSLLVPAVQHHVEKVLFVLFTGDAQAAKRVFRLLRDTFAEAQITVFDVLRADGRRWYPMWGSSRAPSGGVAYDLSAHPFRAGSVLEGQVIHASRAGLAATLEPHAEAVAAVTEALSTLPSAFPDPQSEGQWVGGLIADILATGRSPSAVEIARLLRGMLDIRVRDAAWGPLDHRHAPALVRLWSDVLTRSPAPLSPAPAAVLAWVAWLSGHGALAWCAVDRCRSVDPGYSMAGLVADLLSRAVSPRVAAEADPTWDWRAGLAPETGFL